MDAQGNECRDYRAAVCQKGCGLILLRKDSVQGKHCCLNALRAQNGVLQANTAKLELEAKKQRLKFALREQFLLARVSSLQNAALAYQNKFRHMVHINITKQLVTGSYTGGHDHSLPIAIQRERDSVGFKSRGGTLCQPRPAPPQAGGGVGEIICPVPISLGVQSHASNLPRLRHRMDNAFMVSWSG
ncbi:hypothetical protein SKAU_G00047020 [Synaphobranchus kaupii]|uniref:Uncharacterized protein n=1 Tax=Synaphobranchus kaupii TaxID=118154 RepID=A0A9Q1G295_SYNKA|nr:hypothetical protein SKAU_G00047020 [Synaphobranchus kaupii]